MVYKSRRKIKRSRSKKSRKFRLRSKKMKGGEDKFEQVQYRLLDLTGTTVYYSKIGTYLSDGRPEAVTFKDKEGKTTTKNMYIDQIYKKI